MKRLLALALCVLLIGCIQLAAANASPIQTIKDLKKTPELRRDGLFEVHFISIGAADSILLRMGETTMLVDSGRPKNAAAVVAYLKSVGVNKLDYAVLTHPHDDHLGGFPGILAEIPVDTFYKAGMYEDFRSKRLSNLTKALAEHGMTDITIPAGLVIRLGDATLTFYQWQNPGASQNSRSVMIRAEYGQRSVLLSADIESGAQRAFAEDYGDVLRSDILKMPHHGIGSYQMVFHEAVKPSLGVLTNTKGGAQKVVDVMTARGLKYLTTPKGTVVAVTDGDTWSVWQIPNR